MAIDTTKTPSAVYLGSPENSAHEPNVKDIIDLTNQILNAVGLSSATYFRDTLAELIADISGMVEGDVALVTATAANGGGIYQYDGSEWVLQAQPSLSMMETTSSQEAAASAAASAASATDAAASATDAAMSVTGAAASATGAAASATDAATSATGAAASATDAATSATTAAGFVLASGAEPYDDVADMEANSSTGDYGFIAVEGGVAQYQNIGGTATFQAWISVPFWASLSDLEASSTTGFTEGTFLRVGVHRYEVASSAATDQDVTNAGGVKFYEAGIEFTTLARFKAAVARGNEYRAGDTVFANGDSFKFADDANTVIDGLTGWVVLKQPSTDKLRGTPSVGPISLPAELNNPLGVELYWDGTKVVSHSGISQNMTPYDLIDFELTDVCNHYYVNWNEGNNGNAGTSTGSGNSWKQLDYAFANAVSPAIIHLEDDWVGTNSSNNSDKYFDGKVKIVGAGAGGRTRIQSFRESDTAAGFSWVAHGSEGAFRSTSASGRRIYRSMFDANYPNAYGIPRPITAAADAAAAEATPGTFYSSATELIVNMHDGRVPDPADGWVANSAEADFKVTQNDSAGVILFENIDITNNQGTATKAGLKYAAHNRFVENSAIFGAKSCNIFGASGNGFGGMDGSIFLLEDCHGWYNRIDGGNYHSEISTGTKGEYITFYEYNCTFMNNGYEGWAGQAALSGSANGSTSHDSMHGLRINTLAATCHGAVIADVNGATTFNANVRASRPGSPPIWNACFWHEKLQTAGTHSIMFLWHCAGFAEGDSDVRLLDTRQQSGLDVNQGEIRVAHWAGDAGAFTGNIKDFDGVAV